MNVRLGICTALLTVCVGCPSAGRGEETPEACYEGVRQALKAKDWAAFYYAHDPEIRTEVLLDEQLMAEDRAIRAGKIEGYRAIETDYGVGTWSREYGTYIKDQIYETISESNRALLFREFVVHLEDAPLPRGAEKFGTLKGTFTVSGDTAAGIAIVYPAPYRMPTDYEDLEPSRQETIDRAREQHKAYYEGKHDEHEVKLVRRDGAWFFLEFGVTKSVDEDEGD